MTAVENKIPNDSGLVKKADYNTKISEIENKFNNHNHGKYITTPEFNNFAAAVFTARLARANLVTKTDFDTELKKISDKVTSNKSKHLLVETKLKKLQKFDSSYFRGRSHFEEDGVQNYLVCQPMYKYFLKNGSIESIAELESKGLSNEVIKPPDNTLAPEVKFTGKKNVGKIQWKLLETRQCHI